jgi:hypothetical protein
VYPVPDAQHPCQELKAVLIHHERSNSYGKGNGEKEIKKLRGKSG